jgi:predicted nuclease of predicted toxin-antitoxin system
MSLKLLIDMNLPPAWEAVLQAHGFTAIHWSKAGDPRAPDHVLMDWAVANGYIVFTHDLDFGRMLALTHASGPSVLQVRTQDVLPDHLENVVVAALRQHESDLASGALVVVDESRSRIRVLPI